MSDTTPITREEMIELFGEEMPIEAVSLLFDCNDGSKTVGELRAELRSIADKRSPNGGLRSDIARQLAYVNGLDWAKLSDEGACGKWLRMADAVLALPAIDEALRFTEGLPTFPR